MLEVFQTSPGSPKYFVYKQWHFKKLLEQYQNNSFFKIPVHPDFENDLTLLIAAKFLEILQTLETVDLIMTFIWEPKRYS